MRHIFLLARQRGLDVDAVRDMTPKGSVRQVTRIQAAVLIGALDSGTSPDYSQTPKVPRQRKRRRAGIIPIDAIDITEGQRAMIQALQIDMGWTDERLREWLGQRHFRDGRQMTQMQGREDAQDVIELLKHVVHRHQAAQRRQRIAAPKRTA